MVNSTSICISTIYHIYIHCGLDTTAFNMYQHNNKLLREMLRELDFDPIEVFYHGHWIRALYSLYWYTKRRSKRDVDVGEVGPEATGSHGGQKMQVCSRLAGATNLQSHCSTRQYRHIAFFYF